MIRTHARLFPNGGSQAVRLPKECRFDDDTKEVLAWREGRRVILEPVDEWSDGFHACLGAWLDEIPRPPAGAMKDPFS